MTHIRKPFSASSWEKHNQSAFDFLKRDIESTPNIFGAHYYPVLRPEDYDVDVALYRSERAYKSKEPPIAYIELEVKTEGAGRWVAGGYPYPDIHFLLRKTHLMHQDAVTFWVCYNQDGTDCAMLPIESVSAYPLAQNASQHEDLVYVIPKEACLFGTEAVVRGVDEYFMSQVGLAKKVFLQSADLYINLVNQAYRARHRFKETRQAQKILLDKSRKNEKIVGVKIFL